MGKSWLLTDGALCPMITGLLVQATADEWISPVPGSAIQHVTVASSTVYVTVQAPDEVPPAQDLVADLNGQIPDGIPIVVTTTVGERIDAGTVGEVN